MKTSACHNESHGMSSLRISISNYKHKRQSNRKAAREYYPMHREGARWTVEDTRLLLDLWFGLVDGNKPAEKGEIVRHLNRTISALETRISVVNTNIYGKAEVFFAYEAVLRKERGRVRDTDAMYAHWNKRMDRFLLVWMKAQEDRGLRQWNPSQRYRLPTVAEMASMLRRSVRAVEDRVKWLGEGKSRKGSYKYGFGL